MPLEVIIVNSVLGVIGLLAIYFYRLANDKDMRLLGKFLCLPICIVLFSATMQGCDCLCSGDKPNILRIVDGQEFEWPEKYSQIETENGHKYLRSVMPPNASKITYHGYGWFTLNIEDERFIMRRWGDIEYMSNLRYTHTLKPEMPITTD